MTLKQARDGKTFSQQKLADKSGISRVSIARYERGTQSPNWGTIVLLAKALEIAPGELQFEVKG